MGHGLLYHSELSSLRHTNTRGGLAWFCTSAQDNHQNRREGQGDGGGERGLLSHLFGFTVIGVEPLFETK